MDNLLATGKEESYWSPNENQNRNGVPASLRNAVRASDGGSKCDANWGANPSDYLTPEQRRQAIAQIWATIALRIVKQRQAKQPQQPCPIPPRQSEESQYEDQRHEN